MATYLTPNRHGYSVRFSPFNPDRLVVATSQYFGLTGGGTLFLLELTAEGTLTEVHNYQWTDGLFDVVWSESNPSLVISASGDGALQLWDLNNPKCNPVKFREHKKEVYSLDWSKIRQEQLFLSASWDCTVKLWDPNRQNAINTFSGHKQLVYNAVFSPKIPNCFASVSGDGTLKLWNAHNPSLPTTFRVHDAEVLSCDWCKYEENLIATSGSDGFIRGWDIRNYNQPIFQLKGCSSAIRKIQFSPFSTSVLASVSYDFSTRIWDFKRSIEAVEIIEHHSEFVYGLDWNVLRKGQIADCGWDSLVHVFNPSSLKDL
ncbi:hypothetical protein WA026_022542 [Henosepilachna vigintioctopunctata]|uniref:Peroxin-7 n=1 Tax=Henosepilachna vigintioctopunctata TaxID=420089 RepID=A0AAW1VIP9_9CUCU